MALGFGFWGSKALLSAVELGVFSELAKRPLDREQLRIRLGLSQRGARDFFDALVALGLLQRDDRGYLNTPETDLFLDRAKPSYLGGIFEMANARLYPFWASLSDGLRTGQPQNEVKTGGDFFAGLYGDPARLRQFARSMTALSMGAAHAIAHKFPWTEYRTFVDVGCAEGGIPVQIALTHPHLSGYGLDLPPLGPIFDDYVASHRLGDRLQFAAADMFVDAFPSTDVVLMGHVLHDWDLDQKKVLVKKAYEALPPGGALIVYESVIDDERRSNTFGLLMSLNMLIETPGGFDFTGADCSAWMQEAGFRETTVGPLAGPDSMVIGIK
jgi:hypothetical protein